MRLGFRASDTYRENSMTKNDLVNLEILDMGTDGEGVGKIDGFTVFVNNTVPGDIIEARVLKVKKTYAYAKVERIIKPSEDRVEPRYIRA